MTAYVAAGQIDAEGDVEIHAETAGTMSSYADSRAGGVIKVGRVRADGDILNATNAFVGLPVAGLNVAEIEGDAESVQIQADGVRINAKDFRISSQSSVDTTAAGSAKGGGLIAVAHAVAENELTNHTNVIIGRNATIVAETIDMDAVVDNLFAAARAEGTAGGLTGSARATATNDLISRANVLLEGTAGDATQITGTKGVDISVTQEDIATSRSRRARFFGLGPATIDGRSGLDSGQIARAGTDARRGDCRGRLF